MLPANQKVRFTAAQARNIARRNRVVEQGTYTLIRQQCNQQIKQAAQKEPPEYEARYSVPPMIFGRPIYDHRNMCSRLVTSLQNDGYRVTWDRERYWDLLVSFAPPPKKRSTKDKKKSSSRRPPHSFHDLKKIRRQIEVNKAFGHS